MKILAKRDKDVYRWEAECLHPHDSARMDDTTVRAVGLHVWREMGLSNPPLFRVDPRVRGGYADRTKVVLQPGSNHCLLFHEMAHAMDVSLETSLEEYSSRPRGESLSGSFHDDNWLGLYVEMLDRFMGSAAFNKFWLYKTLHERGLTVSYAPRPRCI